MNKSFKRIGGIIFVILIVWLALGTMLSTFNLGASAPAVETPAPIGPPATQTVPNAGIQALDDVLKEAMIGSLAYNAPEKMSLNASSTIQLLLNSSVSEQDLRSQITEAGIVASATVEITPRMRAELRAVDPDAFLITPLHSDDEQLILDGESTEWHWSVKALKNGNQTMILSVYRLIQYDGKEYWREVKTYQSNINVEVTLTERLLTYDWEWLASLILTAILIPALWRWWDGRKK
jgi:hypothetical protein